MSMILFGLLGWGLFAFGWWWGWQMELPEQWAIFILLPFGMIGLFGGIAATWVSWNRNVAARVERRVRPEDEQPQTAHDRLQRPLVVEDPACHSAAQIEIVLDGDRKIVRVRGARG